MGYAEWSNNKKKKKDNNASNKKASSYAEWSNAKHGITEDEEDIAPVKKTTESEKKYGGGGRKVEDNDVWFKGGAFSDGFDGLSDIKDTFFDTMADGGLGVVKGVGRMAEGLVDLGIYGVGYGADALGFDNFADKAKDAAIYSATDEWTKGLKKEFDDNSLIGNKGDMITEGLGQVATTILTAGVLGAAGVGSNAITAITTGAQGLSTMGTNIGEAYKDGATDGKAFLYGLGTGAIEAATELLSGGLGKSVKALGISRGIGELDDIFAKKLSSKLVKSISNESVQKVLGNTVETAVKSGGEALEEVLSGLGSAFMKWLTYEDDKTLKQLIKDENLLEQAIVGFAVSNFAQGKDFIKANKSKTDYVTGHTANEEKVIETVVEKEIAEREANGEKLTSKEKNKIYDNVVESVQNGSLGIEVIEEALGGESYEAYKKATDENVALKNERDELNKIKTMELTGEQSDRLAELKGMKLDDTTHLDELGKKWKDDVYNRLSSDRKGQGSLLLESYRERARRGQAFTADLSQYEGKKREAVERAIKSGVLNNTNRSHELVNVLSQIEADKGIIFDYTDNKKLKESGFAIGGKTINGYVKDGAITLNMQSSKAWESTVGHEITHVLEGTKVYSELQTSLFEYAKSKGEFDTRKADITKLYENVENADIDAELTAELVSDYLFNDKSFINHLTGNRTVFQKVWDEVKYLYKVATGKEKASIEKVMKEFDRAWKEMGKATKGRADVKYHISEEFSNDIDMALEGKMEENSQVKARDYTPAILVDNGVNDLPMLITQKHLKSIIYSEAEARALGLKTGNKNHYHGLGKDLLIKAVDSMDNPLEIYKQADDRYLIITEVKNGNGDNVIVPVKIDGKGTYNDVYIDENQILSVYGRKNLENYLSKNNFVRVYKKGTALNPEVQFPDISSSSKVETSTTVTTQDAIDDMQEISTDDSIAPLPGNVNTQFSVSEDSEGNQLSKEQSEYFKDSKVVDENGNLKVMYHGTPNGDFTVFKSGTYFTENKEYADLYQNQGASSLGYKKTADNPNTYAVYLDIKKPFDTRNKAERDIFYNEYYRQWGTGTDLMESGLPDWTDGQDLQEFLEENGYDYDGLILDEGATGGYGEEVKSRGLSYVIFNPEQVKNIDNKKPTSDPDIRYSLANDSDGNQLSKEQSEYFKDSLVRDDNGNLLKVYHGSGSEFTVFNHKYLNTHGNAHGRGFYFTEKKSLAEGYSKDGGQLLEGYLNITKPLSEDKVTMKKADLVKLIKATCKAEAQEYVADGGYETVAEALPDTWISNYVDTYSTNLNDAYREVADIIYSGNDNDVEIISEITNAGAGNENTLKLTKDVLGYDGVIYTANDGTHEFVTLVSEQFKSADNINPTDNPDIRFSLSEDTKKSDSEYMLAVENSDIETTQRIVDEAAKSAGYDIKAYHGTGYDFTVFDKSRQGNNYEDWGRLGKGFYFAPTSREAETWAELSRGGKNKVMPVYLRSENMLDSFEALPDNLKDTIPENWDSLTRRLAEKYAYNYIEYMQEFGYNVQEILTEKGYDGINGHTEYVVFDPEQVKSADAITYDDKGNVIPLSERFNKGNEDIRYSLSYENTAHSTFGTPLKDLYFEQDIAPIREDVAKNATTTPKAETYIDDYAPITAEEAEAINKESFEHIGDKDIPPEVERNTDYVPDRIVLDTKSLKQLTKAIGEKLPLTDKFARADLEKIIQDFSTGKIASKEGLVAEVKKKFNTYYYKERSDEIAKIKESIRKIPVYVSDNIKGDFGKGKDGYFNFMQKHFGKIRFSKDGLSVDRLYDALTEVYPGYFSADVWNDAERLRVIADVVDTPTTQNIPQPVDDRTLEDTADFIYDSVQEYKGTVRLTNALDLENAPIDESLVPPVGEDEEVVAPVVEAEVNGEPITPKSTRIADGTRSEELLVESLVNYPMQTVEQKVAEKIRSVEAELADKRDLRREAENDYNNKIANLQKQYADKKDKTTLTAYNLLQSISRLEGLKARADADYAKRISDLEARLEKMKEPTYTRAMQKQAKMQEHAKFAENLLGDTSTWVDKNIGLKYEVNTERRNLRDIVRDENGNKDIARADAIYDALMGEYNRNHAELNRKDNEISKKYHDLKITRAESVYANMLGELRHNPESKLTKEAVAEYYEKHKEKIDVKKVDKVIDYVRADLDYFFETLNAVLREQGMKEIPYRKGYFPHATFPKQGFIAKLLNWKVQDNEIPTSIAGLTEDFKPVKSYQSFDKQRHGDKTDYDIMQMFEKYKDGALDWIYHIEDIQKRRAVENYIRSEYSEEGIQARIKEVYASEDMDADEAQTRIDEILSKSSHLSHFVQDFMTKTNILANKKNSLDRAMEQKFNRNIYSVMQNVQNRTSANMVLANIRSALTNFIPITQSWAQVSPLRSLQATKDVIANAIKDDGMVEKSTFLTNRLKQADKLYQTNWDKILDKAGIMFEVIDNISSQVIWRSKYNQNIANHMTEEQAIANADQFAENVMAGRSKGNEPTLFNAKNPLVKAFTTFQLEVNNQYGYYFKDVPNDLKAETNHWKFNLAKGYTTAFIGAYVYNALLSKVTGSDAALDPIGIIEELLRDLGLFDDDEEKEVSEAFENLGSNVIEELPFVGGILGGGRIPISTALPIKELVTGTDSYGNKKSRWETFFEAAPYTVLPVGYGQIKKTVQGLGMFNTDEEHPVMGSYTDSGKLRFPVEDTPLNRVQAALFGQYANENAREYFDNGYDALNKKQIQEYQDVDLPIADYWKYREGLKGLKKNEEKADFINSLDIEDWQKNILMNNILDRKEDVDMTNYDDYADFEEFDYAQKNPEKYEVAKSFGDFKAFVKYTEAIGKFESDKDENGETISGSEAAKVADYIASLDIDNRQKNILINNYLDRKEDVDMSNYDDYGSWYEFDYAQKNPEKYAVSKAVGGYDAYIKYSDDLKEIEGEKDANGKTKRGTEKANRRNYIFSLKGLDDGQKAILYRSLYDSADDKAEFDEDIVYYINGRNDLTDEEKVTIYTELGFTVKDGYVYW